MADFMRNSAIKSAIRRYASPFPDIDAFDALIQSVILNNPFGCVSYMNAGANHPPVEKIKETYAAKFVYLDGNDRQRGTSSESYDTLAGYRAGVVAVQSHTANISAHGGAVEHNAGADTFAVSLKCHDPNGEMYYVHFSRGQVTVTSYSDDAILTVIETWADGVPAMA
ncbi:MAG: hypothetical protein WCX63_07080 [Methanoregula sp.]